MASTKFKYDGLTIIFPIRIPYSDSVECTESDEESDEESFEWVHVPNLDYLFEEQIEDLDMSKYHFLIGGTKTILFYGLFEYRYGSRQSEYHYCSEHSVHTIHIDEGCLIRDSKFIFEIGDCSWAVVFNDKIIFIRIDQFLLRLIKCDDVEKIHLENENCFHMNSVSFDPDYEIYSRRDRNVSLYLNLSRDGIFMIVFNVDYDCTMYKHNKQRKIQNLTITFEKNPDQRSVNQDSLKYDYHSHIIVHHQGKHNGDTDDEDSCDEERYEMNNSDSLYGFDEDEEFDQEEESVEV